MSISIETLIVDSARNTELLTVLVCGFVVQVTEILPSALITCVDVFLTPRDIPTTTLLRTNGNILLEVS